MRKLHTLAFGIFASIASMTVNAAILQTIAENDYTGVYSGNQSAIGTATNLQEHVEVFINFDLFLFDSWDGDNTRWGTDILGMKVDGVKIFEYSFSNFNPTTGDSNPYAATSVGNFNSINGWGPIDQYFDDFAGGFTLAHTSSTLTVEVYGLNLQNQYDESWRLTDIDIYTIPEPSILGLMGLGFLGLALSRRKLKK